MSKKSEPDDSHLHPADREEKRFKTRGDDRNVQFDYEEVYQYLILFPNSLKNIPGDSEEGKSDDPPEEEEDENEARITFKQAREDWLAAVIGNDEKKKQASDHLAEAWMMRFRVGMPDDVDTIPLSSFHLLCRGIICSKLASAGLQLKLSKSRDGDEMLCRIAASEKKLEAEADRIDYKLSFRPEVDPGFTFWNEDEIEEEARILERDEAIIILENLYSVGKIPAEEVAIFENETPAAFSRRVHTLERVADRVPVSNNFPAFTDYKRDPTTKHLFRRHPSPWGPTVFGPLDQIVLCKSAIDRAIDTGVLVNRGIINGCIALHEVNRGHELTRSWLHKNWVTWWTASAKTVGAPLLSDPRMNDETKGVTLVEKLYSQPLDKVKDYYGAKIGLYFAWLGHYTQSLTYAALMGAIAQFYVFATGSHNTESQLDPVQVFLSCFIVLWAVWHGEMWDRENKIIALKWGMEGFEEEEVSRPQFRGTPRRDPITNRMEEFYSPQRRMLKQFVSGLIILVFIIFQLIGVLFVFFLRYQLVNKKNVSWGKSACGLVQAVLIQILSYYFQSVAETLNEWENHRTATEFEDNMIFKVFLFQIFNNYFALFFIAFWKGATGDGCDDDDCMGELYQQMISIFMVRLLMNFVELGQPLMKQKLAIYEEERALAKAAGAEAKRTGKKKKKVAEMEPFEAEAKLEDYPDTFDDFAEMVLQYGLVTMFVAAFPMTPLLAIIENVIEIRVDAYKMCNLVRRPDPMGAEDIGMWGNLLSAMGTLAIFSNAAMISFTTNSLDDYTNTERWVMFLVAEHFLLACKVFMHVSIPDTPRLVSVINGRHDYVVSKYKLGYEDDDVDEEVGGGEVNVDDLEEGADTFFPEMETEVVGTLQAQLRTVKREMSHLQKRKREIEQIEVFNPSTGVGQTRAGHSLGRLKVTLVSARNLPPADLNGKADPYVVMKVTPPSAGPPPQTSRVVSSSLSPSWNQELVFAPIRTIHASVVFRVMDRDTIHKDELLGEVQLSLEDLKDQKPHDLRLMLSSPSGQAAQDAVLYVRCQFQYSKLTPLNEYIEQLQLRLDELERHITAKRLNLKS